MECGTGNRQARDTKAAGSDPRQHRFDVGIIDWKKPAVTAQFGARGEQRGDGGGVSIGARRVAHLHRQQPACVVDRPLEAPLRARDDRESVAEALGVRHDVSRKQDRRAAIALTADERFEAFLVDRVEAGERFVENDEVGSVDDRSDQLDHLRHALGHFTDFFVDHAFEPELGHEGRGASASLRPVEPAQRSHEGDRFARLHAGIEPAFLGQIADAVAHRLRAFAKDAAGACVGVDNAQCHPQAGGFARAIGAEHAIDAAGWHGEADIVDRLEIAEIFGEASRLDAEIVQASVPDLIVRKLWHGRTARV